MTRRTSDEVKSGIIEMRKRGVTHRRIATAFGVTEPTVQKILWEAVSPSPSACKKRVAEWIIDMRRKHGYQAFSLRANLPDGLTVDDIRLAMVVVPEEDHSYEWCRLSPAAVRGAVRGTSA